jgi:hypothetical protein
MHGLKRRGILQYFTVHRVPECLSLRPNCVPTPSPARECVSVHRVHILIEMKQGECVCPLIWSIRCNFVRDSNYSERGWACKSRASSMHPHQPRCFPSQWNVLQKAAIATLCVLCVSPLGPRGGGQHSLTGEGQPIGRLERKPGTLYNLWSKVLYEYKMKKK